jgi:hypothetical protein
MGGLFHGAEFAREIERADLGFWQLDVGPAG